MSTTDRTTRARSVRPLSYMEMGKARLAQAPRATMYSDSQRNGSAR